jgi:hypothetical protein
LILPVIQTNIGLTAVLVMNTSLFLPRYAVDFTQASKL